ncbi:ATP-binding protein [Streptomyces sp. GC420]|uniref:ATP-binding protein n=1 Tax=Streptomyces sp. GC420 TaxID=2697568 RepID=UPI0028BD859A|nr:ATP-binding protein [Streptomyces sp. GC420]
MPTEPGCVALARRTTAARLLELGITPRSAFADTVLLVVSELVTNVLRHASDHSPAAEVGVTAGAGRLVVGVADRDPRVPALPAGGTGRGLLTVGELAARYDGELSIQPAAHGPGKTVLVRFAMPDPRLR